MNKEPYLSDAEKKKGKWKGKKKKKRNGWRGFERIYRCGSKSRCVSGSLRALPLFSDLYSRLYFKELTCLVL